MARLTPARDPSDALAAWLDPEFWGPPGRGCAHCGGGAAEAGTAVDVEVMA